MSEHRGDRDAGEGRDRMDGKSGDGSGGADPNDPFAGYVFDEDFVKGATRTEGSARARMLARKWANEPPEQQPWRADGPRRPGGRKRLRTVVVTVAVLALVAFAAAPDRVFGWFESSNTATADEPVNQPPVTLIATSAPSGGPRGAGQSGRPTRANPFAGSPAVSYADNEAGITLPEVKPVAGFTPAEVADALETTRRLLIAGNLDRDVLAGGRPAAFLAAVDPATRFGERLEAAIAANRWEDSPLLWVTRFDPKEVEPVGKVVKVTGVMSYDLDAKGGLVVHADYSFVYPVARTGGGSGAEVTRSVIRRELNTRRARAGDAAPTPPGTVALVGVGLDIANSACSQRDGYVHPEFSSTNSGPQAEPSHRSDPYDRRNPMSFGRDECGVSDRI
ncbi:hypothetical protein [Embleya sp. AB8]|uniref:SCO2583/SCO2584 N-terminal domain-containing protein n=1 Tax=Embleya sp. AB8 TaxID=3156304 RepID=UPI003C78A422